MQAIGVSDDPFQTIRDNFEKIIIAAGKVSRYLPFYAFSLYKPDGRVVVENMRRFHIPAAADGTHITLSGSDAKHIRTVLRMKTGDCIFLFDDEGFEYRGEIIRFEPKGIGVRLLQKYASESESATQITLAQAVLKDRKLDEIIRQATELGVAAIVPFLSHRSVSRPDTDRLMHRKRRWEKIADESLKQCGRSRAPEIRPAESFSDMLENIRECPIRIAFWENESAPLSKARFGIQEGGPRRIAVLVGPEGGFAESEIREAESAGFVTCSLGPRILKADTAAVAACTLVQFLFGDMG